MRKKKTATKKKTTSKSGAAKGKKKTTRKTTKKRKTTRKKRTTKKRTKRKRKSTKGKGKSSKKSPSKKEKKEERLLSDVGPSLSVFGSTNDLDFFGDEDLFANPRPSTSRAAMNRDKAAEILKAKKEKAAKSVSESDSSNDLLSGILSSQEKVLKPDRVDHREKAKEIYSRSNSGDSTRVISTSVSMQKWQKKEEEKRKAKEKAKGDEEKAKTSDFFLKRFEEGKKNGESSSSRQESANGFRLKRPADSTLTFEIDRKPLAKVCNVPSLSKTKSEPRNGETQATPSSLKRSHSQSAESPASKRICNSSTSSETSTSTSNCKEDKIRDIMAAIKPHLRTHYDRGIIDKTQYKVIMKKCLEKIHKAGGKVNGEKVKDLVTSYVMHYM